MELSDFITSYLKTTEDDFNTKIEEQAKKTVQLEQALRLIAKKEKLELSDKDYEKENDNEKVQLKIKTSCYAY